MNGNKSTNSKENIELDSKEIEEMSKEDLSQLIDDLRERRTELNSKASEFSSERNKLNEKVSELAEEAKKHKRRRNKINDSVESHKEHRDVLNERANELDSMVENLDLGQDSQSKIEDLQDEVNELETKQQTQVMDPEEENNIVEKIREKKQEIKRYKRQQENAELADNINSIIDDLRECATSHHKKIVELAHMAQDEHNKMVEKFEESDNVREEADRMHEKFVEMQESADAHHNRLVELYKRIDKNNNNNNNNNEQNNHNNSDDDDIDLYERLNNGEKITKHDIVEARDN